MKNKKKKTDVQLPQILNLDDDFSLIKRFIEGDESTFNLLVLRHKEKVRNIIYLTLNNHELVDDFRRSL